MKVTKLVFATLALVFALASCSKSGGDELTAVIPSDASYVVYLNTESIIKKSDYDIFENVAVSRSLGAAKAFLSNQDAVKTLDAFTKDANALGINLKKDAYFYTNYKQYGLIFSVNDAAKIKQALVNFSVAKEEDVVEDGGVYTFSPSPMVSVVWDKSKMLILGNVNVYAYGEEKEEDLSLLAKNQLKQNSDNSINKVEAFSKFYAGRKDISLFYSYSGMDFDALAKLSGVQFPEDVKKELEELKGVSSAANVTFEKGEVVFDNQVYYDNSDVEKKYKDLMAKMTGDIKGNQLKYLLDEPIFFMTANLKGSGIYDHLNKFDLLSSLESDASEAGIDVKSIFDNVEGDVTMALTNIVKVKKSYESYDGSTVEYDTEEPQMLVFADVKDGASLFNVIKENMSKVDSITMVDDKTIKSELKSITNYIGLVDNVLYFTNDQAVYDKIKAGGSKGIYESKAAGKVMYISGSFVKLREVVKSSMSNEAYTDQLLNGFNQLAGYDYQVEKDLSGKGKLEFTDKSKNSMAVICQFVDGMLTTLSSGIGF